MTHVHNDHEKAENSNRTFGNIVASSIIFIGAIYLFGYTAGGTVAKYTQGYQEPGEGVYEISDGSSETVRGKSQSGLPVREESGSDRESTGSNIKLLKVDREPPEQSGGKNIAYAESEAEPKREIDDGKADINALAMAVSFAETGGCKTGTAITHNNCLGIRANGNFVRYKTTDASLDDFKVRWTRSYDSRFPTRKDAVLWTNNDKPDIWMELVKQEYQRRIDAKNKKR